MARPKKLGKRKQVSATIDKYHYDYLTSQAEKQGISISKLVSNIIKYQVERQFGSVAVALDDEQTKRLHEIAAEKDMSVNDLTTRIVENFIRGYF